MSDQDEIFRVQESVVPQLLAQPGVTGVAVGFREKDGKPTDEIVIRVYVQDKRPLAEVPAELRIPSEIGGFKTDVIQKGPDVPSVLEEIKGRPLVSGLEISRALSGGGVGRGTIGCFVSDRLPDNIRSQVGQPGFGYTQHVYLLSASHVLNPTENTVDGIVHQPSPSAYINRVGEILKDRCVLSGAVDAGLARLDAGMEWKNDVHDVGTIDGIRRVKLGETVWKQGVTTGLTSRKVEAINYFTNNYQGIRVFGPAMQISPNNPYRDPFLSEGDSGSLVWVWDNNPQGGRLLRAVGLAISHNDVFATACHLDTVFERLKIEFPLTKAGKGANLYSSGLSPYPAYVEPISLSYEGPTEIIAIDPERIDEDNILGKWTARGESGGPYTFAVDPALPDNLRLSREGIFSGSSYFAGLRWKGNVTASDRAGIKSAPVGWELQIIGLYVQPNGRLEDAYEGRFYSIQLRVIGDWTEPCIFGSFDFGNGLTLNSRGLFSGTPRPGSGGQAFTHKGLVTDAKGRTAEHNIYIRILPPPR